MIIEYLIISFMRLIKLILSIAGVLPEMPETIQNALEVAKDFFLTGVPFLSKILSIELTIALFITISAYLTFIIIYQPIVWIYTKIRG